MNKIDARQFVVDEICSRWSVWKTTPKLIDDFAEALNSVGKEYALNAVKKLRAENNYNSPDFGKLKKYCDEQTKKKLNHQDIPVTVVFEVSGSRLTIWVKVPEGANAIHLCNRTIEMIAREDEKRNIRKWDGRHVLFIGEENQSNAIKKSMEIKGVSFPENWDLLNRKDAV